MKRSIYGSLIGLSIAVTTLFIAGCGSDTTVASKNEAKTETSSLSKSSNDSTTESTEAAKKKVDNSAFEFYDAIQDNDLSKYTLNSAAREFLKAHSDLFPSEDIHSIPDNLIDYTSKSEHISKSPDKYGDKLIYLQGVDITQIREEDYPGGKLTWFNAADDNNNFYTVIYRGELPGIIEGNVVNIIGLPVGSSYYDNTSGGQTLTIVLAGCNVTLYESSNNNAPQNSLSNNSQQQTEQPIQSTDLSEYVLPYSDSTYYTMKDVVHLTPEDIRIAINEIYARHGRMFTSKDLQDYFNSKSWYHPTVPADQFDESTLNDFEKKNIELLKPLR